MRKYTTAIVLLCAILALSLLGACAVQNPTDTGSSLTTSKQPADSTSTTESTAPSTSAKTDGPMTRYDPVINLEYIRMFDQTIQSEMTELGKQTGETVEDNGWTKEISDKLGINVTYRWWSATGDEYNQKLRLAMSSNDLPDFFYCGNLTDIQQLADAGVIAPLSEAYETYALDSLKTMMMSGGKAPFERVTFDGELYGIPLVTPPFDSYSYTWIRADWLNKLGLKIPETMNDFINVMYAFMDADFDGNGKKDTLGMIIDKGLWGSTRPLFWGFGAYPQHWVEADGKLAFGATQPAMKDALRILQQLYKDGAIDREFGTKDATKSREPVISGNCGVMFGGHWEPFTLINNKEIEPDADWIAIPAPSATGSPTVGVVNPGGEGWVCVNSKVKNPEAIVKMFNLYFDHIYGENADFDKWYMTTNNYWKFSPVYMIDPINNITAYNNIIDALDNNTTDKLTGVAKGYYANFEIDGGWAWQKMFGKGQVPMKVLKDVIANDLYFTNKFVGSQTPTMIERWSTLEEIKTNIATQIILGELEVDAGFDRYLKEWEQLGGTQITKEVNDG